MNDVVKKQDDLEGSRMTFGEHLTELRTRLIRALFATLVTFFAATIFADDLVRIVLGPFQAVMRSINANPALVATGPTTALVVYFKVSLIAAMIIAAPVWIQQTWAFIAAGLYKTERRWVTRFAPLSFGLFFGGVAFGYWVLLPVALRWLLTFPSPDLIQNWITIDSYASLFTTLTLVLGLAFQLPVVMLGLAKAGIVSAEGFRKKRKITILLIFIVAGILTPPDPITQPLVALPLCLLFELGILLAWFGSGAKREPVQWKRWRKRLVWIAALAALVFVFRERIAGVWGGYDATQRVETRESRLPWAQVGASVLGRTPEAALRVNDDAAAPMLAVAGGGRVAILRFTRSDEPAVVVNSVESRTFRAMVVPTGATVWKVDLPAGLRVADALGPAVRALRLGDFDTRKVARILVTAAAGALPGDDEEAADAADAWLASRADATFAQPR